MKILECRTGRLVEVVILPVTPDDLKVLTAKRYFFSWRRLKSDAELFKLTLKGSDDILGVAALIDFPSECRIELKLLAASRENVGKDKNYEDIAACLMAYACGKAVKKYAVQACVSLLPKTTLKKHYIDRYNMWDGGKHVFFEGPNLHALVKKYLL